MDAVCVCMPSIAAVEFISSLRIQEVATHEGKGASGLGGKIEKGKKRLF